MAGKTVWLVCVVLVLFWGCEKGQVQTSTSTVDLHVSAAKTDCADVPVCATIELPAQLAQLGDGEISVVVKQRDGQGMEVPGQIVTAEEGKRQLWWVIPQTRAGVEGNWTATLGPAKKTDAQEFSWDDRAGEYLDLLFAGRKVTRYMYAYNDSTPEQRQQTYKPYHHVFDFSGQNFITKGPGGLYTHHRGLFIGWHDVEFAGKKYDFWAMTGGWRDTLPTVQVHKSFTDRKSGPVLARSASLIDWNDDSGKTLVSEQRQVTVYRCSGDTIALLDFDISLTAIGGDVLLEGDPEHGGFQYRAHNDVAADDKSHKGKATYLFHRTVTDPHKDKNLPWAALSYPLKDTHYSVQHMDHLDNPNPTLYSAYRGYGRFGPFFSSKISAGETLRLHYRVWLGEGPMPKREDMAARYLLYAGPPAAVVVK